MARKNMYIRGGDERPAKAYRSDTGPQTYPSSYPPAAGAPAYGGAGGLAGDRNIDNPPCNTLFIGNLTPAVSDNEIESYFHSLKGDGFVTCKVNRSNPNRVSAFVQFAEIAIAQDVHDSQQGKELPGSDRGPMRIQFSKNPLGEFSKRRREEAAYGMAHAQPHADGSGMAQPVATGAPAYAVGPADATAVQPQPHGVPSQVPQDVQVHQQGAPVATGVEYMQGARTICVAVCRGLSLNPIAKDLDPMCCQLGTLQSTTVGRLRPLPCGFLPPSHVWLAVLQFMCAYRAGCVCLAMSSTTCQHHFPDKGNVYFARVSILENTKRPQACKHGIALSGTTYAHQS
jgi:hypothetical protein